MPPISPEPTAPIGVVIATRDRAPSLLTTLERLTALPERPPVMVVDNGSEDGTADLVAERFPAERFPAVRVLRLPVNRGPLARNLGVRALPARYIAFSDDDSWWAPGALSAAVDLMDAEPRIGLLAARIAVGRDLSPDPINEVLAASPSTPPPACRDPPCSASSAAPPWRAAPRSSPPAVTTR